MSLRISHHVHALVRLWSCISLSSFGMLRSLFIVDELLFEVGMDGNIDTWVTTLHFVIELYAVCLLFFFVSNVNVIEIAVSQWLLLKIFNDHFVILHFLQCFFFYSLQWNFLFFWRFHGRCFGLVANFKLVYAFVRNPYLQTFRNYVLKWRQRCLFWAFSLFLRVETFKILVDVFKVKHQKVILD